MMLLLAHAPWSGSAVPSVLELAAAWTFEPLTLIPWLLTGLIFARGLTRLRRRGRANSTGRRACFFAAGHAVAALALLSPLHALAEDLFSAHMLQHLLLVNVAVPLYLLANPLPIVIWSLDRPRRLRIATLLAADGAIVGVLRALTRPPLAWTLFVAAMWLWHLPDAYQAALESEPLHALQHASFFGASALFWWPVIGPAPLRSRLRYPARMLYVFLAWIPNSALGAGITFAPRVLIEHYAVSPRHFALDPLADQQLAGLLMWIPGDAIYASAMIALLLAMVRAEGRFATAAVAEGS